jgi:general secretion pathway protein G
MTAKPATHHKKNEGFTLIELLIVLSLVAFFAGVAVPQMNKFLKSIQYSFDRADIMQAVSDLPFKAFINNKKITIGEGGEDEEKIQDETEEEKPKADDKSHLSLPEGWSFDKDAPVIYRSDGLCMGGEIRFKSEEERKLKLILDAPHCFPRLPEESP